ncbi:MAG TPA: response regulator transcription factor [Anaerolineae bacterium]|nr:response regulator transcription factor [Anaerolineae bacterium]
MDTRVLVVDDHPVVRQGLRSLLSQYPGIQVIGEAESGPAALELVAKLQPDVVLLDIRLAGPSGLDVARQLRRSQPNVRVIILTSHDDEAYLIEAAQAGVHGYLLKSASAELLAEAIVAVHAGESRLSPALVRKTLEQLEALSRAQAQSESGLSDQELQLLQLLATGASTQRMAQSLYLSERTVKRKIQDILTKLGAASRAQAVAEAFKRGLL